MLISKLQEQKKIKLAQPSKPQIPMNITLWSVNLLGFHRKSDNEAVPSDLFPLRKCSI